MHQAVKMGGFALGLVAVFGAAVGIGAALGPEPVAATAQATGEDSHGHGDIAEGTSASAGAPQLPGGLAVSQDGYTLDLTEPVVAAGADIPLSFRVLGPDGAPVRSYATEHEKDLHLIAVRRDLSQFQHVHPVLDEDGTWSVPLDLTVPGDYRVFADFRPADRDEGLTLGADLTVPGTVAPTPLAEPAAIASVDGYEVRLDGALVPGAASELTLTVSRAGEPVTDLQPYLGAYGHLVALRAADLAYLHVHPDGVPGDGVTQAGPGVVFWATAPSVGDYRLYLDFRHGDVVRTAEFTMHAAPAVGHDDGDGH